MKRIYHYTTANNAAEIINSGRLSVSEWEMRNTNVRPALWLSLNPFWEKTANKSIRSPYTGNIHRLSFGEQSRLLGCVRFVIPFSEESFCPWSLYGVRSGTSKRLIKGMEAVGRQHGANPKDWYASFSDIPLSMVLEIQVWDGENWISWCGDVSDSTIKPQIKTKDKVL